MPLRDGGCSGPGSGGFLHGLRVEERSGMNWWKVSSYDVPSLEHGSKVVLGMPPADILRSQHRLLRQRVAVNGNGAHRVDPVTGTVTSYNGLTGAYTYPDTTGHALSVVGGGTPSG